MLEDCLTYQAATEDDHDPEVEDLAAQVLHAVLVDRMIEDVRTLAKINEPVAIGKAEAHRGGRVYREIPYLFVGPDQAACALVAGLRFPQPRHGPARPQPWRVAEFFLFDPAYMQRAIERGQQDARAMLAPSGGGIPWRVDHPPSPERSG